LDILAIYGSPRRHGSTDTLLDAFVSAAEEAGASVHRLCPRDMNIRWCLGCRQCEKLGKCVVTDDMQQVYPLFESARAVVLASPVFFYTMTSCVKPVIDRAQALWARKYVLKNPLPEVVDGVERAGYFLSCGATRGQNLFEGMLLTMKYFYDALSVKQAESLLYRRIENRADVEKHPRALAEAAALGGKAAARILAKEG
jgi:multimeric flavodoxin WrbA